ncbi:MAG: chemotaxis response regulator protein-glutamate methylesterase [Myxococcaceae bacterium]
MSPPARAIRVLIVDDSSLVRTVLKDGLEADGTIRVVGTARDPYEARDLLVQLKPDVMTLDVEMPRMDGVTFLRKFMAVIPTPTIVLSSLTAQGSQLALDALDAGAFDVVTKPSSRVAEGVKELMVGLVARVKAAAKATVERRAGAVEVVAQKPLERSTDLVIGLGASTGGVAALGRILPAFPAWTPGVVIVQHMPEGFTRQFAERLDGLCQMRVSEARDGDRVLRGHILVAPGGTQHLVVERAGGEYRVRLVSAPPVSGHRPSVDVFFNSLADHVGPNAAACLMTGMGNDGAEGLLHMRNAGGHTFAQDHETSAVWGMPAAAAELNAAQALVPLENIPRTLLGVLEQRPQRVA